MVNLVSINKKQLFKHLHEIGQILFRKSRQRTSKEDKVISTFFNNLPSKITHRKKIK